jgi:hypothetical protein
MEGRGRSRKESGLPDPSTDLNLKMLPFKIMNVCRTNSLPVGLQSSSERSALHKITGNIPKNSTNRGLSRSSVLNTQRSSKLMSGPVVDVQCHARSQPRMSTSGTFGTLYYITSAHRMRHACTGTAAVPVPFPNPCTSFFDVFYLDTPVLILSERTR